MRRKTKVLRKTMWTFRWWDGRLAMNDLMERRPAGTNGGVNPELGVLVRVTVQEVRKGSRGK